MMRKCGVPLVTEAAMYRQPHFDLGSGLATTRAVVHSAVAILVANYFITDLLTNL